MATLRRLLRLLDLDTREGRTSFALLLVLVVAFGISLIADPSPLLAGVLGASLVALILLRTLLAMGVRFGRDR